MDLTRIHRSARSEGFAIDYRLTAPLDLCRLPPLRPILDIREPFQFSPEDGLQQFPTFPDAAPEKLTIGKDTAALLSSIQTFRAVGEQEEYEFRTRDKRRLEEVLVRADFDRNNLNERRHLRADTFLMFKVDEDGDGGLGWSESVRKSTSTMQNKMQMEKLDIEPHVLRFLKETSVPHNVVEETFYESTDRTSTGLGPITPPLLPVQDWDTKPLPPIVMADIIEGLSPIEVGTTVDLVRELEEPFMTEDRNLEPGSPTSFIVTGTQEYESPVRPRQGRIDHKIEVPLTPPATVIKKVRFSSILAADDVVLSFIKEELPAPDFFEDIARPEAVKLEQALGQEQLHEADSTMRIKVPVMDFSVPKPPWESGEYFMEIKKWAMVPANRWQGARSVEINLRWVPFPSEYGKIPKEAVEGDEDSIQALLISKKDCKEAEEALLDALNHLSIEDELLEEEELEPGLFDAKPDRSLVSMAELVQRQKRKREAKSNTHQHMGGAQGDQGQKRRATEEAISGGMRFSAANSLSSFMTLRAKKPSTTTTKQPTKSKPNPIVSAPLRIHSQQLATLKSLEIPKMPLPQLPDVTKSASFVISTKILSERSLFRELKELYPSASFVERDYSAQIPSGEYIFLPPSTAPVVDDADLIVSPRIGVVYTTLQQLRQRPLPGQKLPPENDIKARILNLTPRYERLLVFVSTPGPLKAASDSEVLGVFLGYCASLQRVCTVIPRILKAEHAARWILDAMAHERTEYKLIEDETLWESFLRKAGLNAFAAQVVLREVRGPGLAGLLAMGEEGIRSVLERTAGEKVAGRVSKVLSGTWGI